MTIAIKSYTKDKQLKNNKQNKVKQLFSQRPSNGSFGKPKTKEKVKYKSNASTISSLIKKKIKPNTFIANNYTIKKQTIPIAKSEQLLKNKVDVMKLDLKDKSLIVRFKDTEYNNRQDFIMKINTCQICNIDTQSGTPHHAKYGTHAKDDRFLVNIGKNCSCHHNIHFKSYEGINLTKKEIEDIGWQNNLDYLESKENQIGQQAKIKL
ncbi:MAG: hypothetical protein DRG78_05965 [Epsilonproteobacteria bacterium]|nr:MAG: hypothetical protein DRG78_05965 [Campylobacterota bacterium]